MTTHLRRWIPKRTGSLRTTFSLGRRCLHASPRLSEAAPPPRDDSLKGADIYKPWYLRNFDKPSYKLYLRHFIVLTLISSMAINTLWDRMAMDEHTDEYETEKAILEARILACRRQLGQIPDETPPVAEDPASRSEGPTELAQPARPAQYF
ncbi:hypothetical protein IWQ60_011547 [Tieghemiomyces parasiticus]|uniref:Uncharacterized protein n=1 Tax=Tieghemiomyces parasiticus TaxID=78921 RepID=A0A9W7ZN48_9FUNG|nr:hypothetical protein IWQ60_011547 [Tieghemiomyces parasiticus]